MKIKIYIIALLAIALSTHNSFCMQKIEIEIQEKKDPPTPPVRRSSKSEGGRLRRTRKINLSNENKETKIEVLDMLINTKELKNKKHAKKAIKQLKKHAKWLKTQTPQKRCMQIGFNGRHFIVNNKKDLEQVNEAMLKYSKEKEAALKNNKDNNELVYYIGPVRQDYVEKCGLCGLCCLDTCARSSLCCVATTPLYACCGLISPIFACLSPWLSNPDDDFLLDEAIFRPPNNITKKIWKDSALEKYLGKLLEHE